MWLLNCADAADYQRMPNARSCVLWLGVCGRVTYRELAHKWRDPWLLLLSRARTTLYLNTVHYGLLQVAKQQEVVPKQVIDPGKLVSQAYAIASRDGISALSARKVATACGIAIGSVYAHHPTKDALR